LALVLDYVVVVATLFVAVIQSTGHRAPVVTPSFRPNVQIPTTGGGSYSSVSCVDAANCIAVGEEDPDSFDEPIYASETNGVWSTNTEIPASGGGSYSSVSCVVANRCVAVGMDNKPDDAIYNNDLGVDDFSNWRPSQ
jgi:hypothetical protein